MILGIDAFNLSSGGGITHLIELLRAAAPDNYGFKKVIIWGGRKVLAKIDDRDWLEKIHEPMLDKGLFFRVFWHRFMEKKSARHFGCDIVFLPGGTVASGFTPTVTMSRNMLPFEWQELKRYGWSATALKLLLLKWTQSRSFCKTDGLIFLTAYAQKVVKEAIKVKLPTSVTIPHGISTRFFQVPRSHHRAVFTTDSPCRILYVSIVSPYKHQWVVVQAVAKLREMGFAVALELIGPKADGTSLLSEVMQKVDPNSQFIAYRGEVPYELLETYYSSVDIGLFASSCENMPNILLEGMAAGLPMACSNMGPMPEVLGDAGEYFDPLDSDDIARALVKLIESPELRSQKAQAAYVRARQYSWVQCANKTFEFLADIAENHKLKI
jgi:glycosyltransferase involved in cell wall biosynthesis